MKFVRRTYIYICIFFFFLRARIFVVPHGIFSILLHVIECLIDSRMDIGRGINKSGQILEYTFSPLFSLFSFSLSLSFVPYYSFSTSTLFNFVTSVCTRLYIRSHRFHFQFTAVSLPPFRARIQLYGDNYPFGKSERKQTTRRRIDENTRKWNTRG